MPMMNFEQLYPALLSNLKASEDEIFFGLYDGYDGVYPFMTANITTPYTIAFSDLSKTGPVVVDLPPGAIYGVIDNAWMQPIHEIDGEPGKLLLVGPGQDYPKEFDGKIVQSDTFRVLYFYRALGTGDEARKLRTAVQAYKLSDAANPPKTRFVKYEPKPGDKIALNTQPRDMRFWELVNAYVQREPMADRDRFFYAWLKDLGIEKGKAFEADRRPKRDPAAGPGRGHGHVPGDLLQQDRKHVPYVALRQGFRLGRCDGRYGPEDRPGDLLRVRPAGVLRF